MKKTLLSIAFVLAAGVSATAQTTLLDQNFNSYTTAGSWPVANWVQHNVDGKTPDPAMGTIAGAFTATSPWGLLSMNGAPTNLFVGSTSWFTPAGQANRWLISPSIDLSSYTNGKVTLTFKSQSGDPSFPDGYDLYVSTTSTAVADFGTTTVHQETAANASWATQTVDLSSYMGEIIYIGWKHNSNDKAFLFLDDIKVVYADPASSEQFFVENFTLYPNPTTDVLNISSKNGLNVSEIRITDMTGKVVKVQKDVSTVNVSNLAAGTYLIDITTKEGKATSKFIKK